jgi:hypothetical protein
MRSDDTMGYLSDEVLQKRWRALISLPGMTRAGSMGMISAPFLTMSDER